MASSSSASFARTTSSVLSSAALSWQPADLRVRLFDFCSSENRGQCVVTVDRTLGPGYAERKAHVFDSSGLSEGLARADKVIIPSERRL